MSMRLFLAAEVPESHKVVIERAMEPLRSGLPGVRWAMPETWHLTVKFLGEVPEERVGELARLTERAASRIPVTEAGLTRLGAFPSPRRARVLWVGLEDAGGVRGVAPPPEGARGGTEPYTPEGGDGGPEARHRERGKGLFYANPRSQGTLAVLTGLLERGLGEASFRREPKLWRPHVTVGRLRDPAPVGEALETVAPDALKAPPFRISEIVLFRSRLHPGGAVHDVLERFPFLG